MPTLLTEVKVDGTDVGAYLQNYKVNLQNHLQEKDNVVINLVNTALSAADITLGKTVTIKRGSTTATDNFLFQGKIPGELLSISKDETGSLLSSFCTVYRLVVTPFPRFVFLERSKYHPI